MGGQQVRGRKAGCKEMRTEEKEIKRWDRQEQDYILRSKNNRGVEIVNTRVLSCRPENIPVPYYDPPSGFQVLWLM